MHIALSIPQLRVISPNPRKNFSNVSALPLLCPHDTGTGERGWAGPRLSSTDLERASSINGSDWHTLDMSYYCFSKSIVWWVAGAVWSHVPSSCGHLGKAFELLSVLAPWWDSVHSWTGASLQAEGLLASPAVAPMCCHELIGTAENLALHLRHVLLSLWISNYGKKRLFKSCFENVFQILSFSNNKHC